MEILTDRLRISELSPEDAQDIAKIARDMSWNDTLNLLTREDIDGTTFAHFGEAELYTYREKLREAGYLSDPSELYRRVPQDFIPEENWHINFSQLPPPFMENAQNFIEEAIKRKQQPDRQGYWLAIRDKETNKIIGGFSISSRILKDSNGKNKIGHAGMFLHPDYQRKGIVSEANAVMIDFMYKYLFDELGKTIPPNTYFYTMCHPLNVGSQKMQEKAGGVLDTQRVQTKGKFEFYATRQQQEDSRLFEKEIGWQAHLDSGEVISSTTGKKHPLAKEKSPGISSPTNMKIHDNFVNGGRL